MKRPDISERMVVRYKDDDEKQHYMLVEEVQKHGGGCEGHALINFRDCQVMLGPATFITSYQITGIYGRVREDGHIIPMNSDSILELVIFGTPHAGDTLWVTDEVKEMTVDEISKKLGYPVKVVGNDAR